MLSGRTQVSQQAIRSRKLLPFLAALLVLAGACAPAGDGGPELVEGRLAVLPFTGPSGDADELAAAMEGAVTAAAADVAGAEVVPVGQADEVAATGAAMVLRGTVSRSGDDVEISAEIVDPMDETRKHVMPIERVRMAGTDAAVERIASRVAGALAQHLDPDATAPWHYPVPTLEAWRVFQHADSLFAENAQAEALPYYYETYALDTMFIGSLFAAVAIHNNAGRGAVGDSLLREIEARADLLDEMGRYRLVWYRGNEAGHHWARTWPAFRSQYLFALHATGDHETELAEAQLARADFPDSPWWIFSEMMARAGLGQADAVLAQFDTTQMLLETNELSTYWENVEDIAVELMVHGQAEAGQSLQEKVVEHYRAIGNPVQLADALGFAGRPQEAFEVLAPVVADATTPDPIGWYGAAAAISGDAATAEQALARLEGLPSAATANNLRYQAAIHGSLGNRDRAIELYRQATEAGFSYSSARMEWWHRDWETQPVRDNCPAFQTLLNKG